MVRKRRFSPLFLFSNMTIFNKIRDMTLDAFHRDILQGVPESIPNNRPYVSGINHAPRRKDILSTDEKKLAVRNALRYFPKYQHKELAGDFLDELLIHGRIYMFRYRPEYSMYARPILEYPGKSLQVKAIMLMIQNNLDQVVAQHLHELITYGGNGAVFQNWIQYRLVMKYLAELVEDELLERLLYDKSD